MSAVPNSTPQTRVAALVKEAIVLSDEVAEMDQRIESDIRKQKGELVVWWEDNVESNKALKFGVEKGVDLGLKRVGLHAVAHPAEDGLKAVFTKLLLTLGITAGGPAEILVAAVLAPFTPIKNDAARARYYDDNPQLLSDFYKKRNRLQKIYAELFVLQPPSASSLTRVDECQFHACMKSRP